MVTDGTQVKILAWYDNEWGYANRLVELAAHGRAELPAAVERRGQRAAHRAGGDLRNYALVTGAYWADTIADGAIRVLVLFYFYELGYSPFEVALAVPLLRGLRRSSPTSSAAGSPPASGCKRTLLGGPRAPRSSRSAMLARRARRRGSSCPT